MKRNVVGGILAAVVFIASVVGLMTAPAPVTAAAPESCEQECYQEYRRCVPFCSKNPCFVSCETVLEICLSNCESES